jgi:hypothetical protein
MPTFFCKGSLKGGRSSGISGYFVMIAMADSDFETDPADGCIARPDVEIELVECDVSNVTPP